MRRVSLIGERIPFAMEKPCAVTAADAHDIAARAAQAGVFAAVPFVIRYSPFVDTIRESGGRRRSTSCSSSSAAWSTATTSSASNGCCTVPLPAAAAAQSRGALPRPVPRAAAGHHAAGRRRGDVEPLLRPRHRGPRDRADARWRCNLLGGDRLSVSRAELGVRPALFDPHRAPLFRRTRQPDTGDSRQQPSARGALDEADQSFFYPTFVTDTLAASPGESPVADLADMAAAMDLVEAAYAASPLTPPVAAPVSPPGRPR